MCSGSSALYYSFENFIAACVVEDYPLVVLDREDRERGCWATVACGCGLGGGGRGEMESEGVFAAGGRIGRLGGALNPPWVAGRLCNVQKKQLSSQKVYTRK